MQQPPQYRYRQAQPRPQPKSSHKWRRITLALVALIFLALIVKGIDLSASYFPSAIPEIKSGLAGYCLDDHHDGNTANTIADSWSCNGSAAQDWVANNNTIRHGQDDCLSIANGSDHIVVNPCTGGANQVWVSAVDGYENTASAECLDSPGKGDQLLLASCDALTEPAEAWQASTWSKQNTSAASSACSGDRSALVACNAAKQWVAWQASGSNHEALLNNYSDGNGYEEWCADFVSYIYKAAGYPFDNGERDGWDEYLAGNIQNMGFTYHAAGSYIPQAGDVAYFDYPGGHVEIVAVGGSKPIFIYGDSGTTDPTTNNGQMTENTLTSDPTEGQLLYYLSPN